MSENHGLTVREVAKRYRVSPDKVRTWIRSGKLGALNTNLVRCGKPRWVVLPEHLTAFEKAQQAVTDPPKPPRRKRTPPGMKDYYPDY